MTKKRKPLLLSLLTVLLGSVLTFEACQMNSKPEWKQLKTSDNIVYFYDHRTQLCFAALNSTSYVGFEITSITNVPCDHVPKMLIDGLENAK